MLRPALILGLTALLVGGATLASASPTLTPPRYKPAADAYVTAADPRANFGRARVLRSGKSPAARAYIRFDLTSLADATITKATLRLGSFSRNGRFAVRVAGSGWSERRITMRNAPRPGRVIASVKARRGLLSINVSKAVTAGKQVTFVLTSTKPLRFQSREAGSTPRLDLLLQPAPVVLAAGDIADCGTAKDAETAALIQSRSGTVAALGDLAYENATLDDFNNCYQPTWGAFKARTRPAPGNHEYQTPGAAGYFAYWGSVAGNPAQGWYSYDLGAWHVVSLNSNCSSIGGCFAGSPQEAWLRADLASHRTTCTLAYWHEPLFTGSPGTEDLNMAPIWQALYDNNADLVLAAHAHNYQRFAPQNAAGGADPARGMREFIVGTGGRAFHPVGPAPNLELANASTWGVLQLALFARSYDWQFVPIAGQTFTDSGSQSCH